MSAAGARRQWIGVVILAAGWHNAAFARADEGQVRVTVVAILATDQNQRVDPELKNLAEEVQKKEHQLTGFRLGRMTCKSIPVGGSDSYPLVGPETASVLVNEGPDKKNRVGLTVKPPAMHEIAYRSACGKFFPIITPYQTKDNDRLIIAIMVQCGPP